MLDLLKEIGGWSVIDHDFDISEWDFQITLEKLQNNYSLGGLFFWIVAEDDKNSSGYIIQVRHNLDRFSFLFLCHIFVKTHLTFYTYLL